MDLSSAPRAGSNWDYDLIVIGGGSAGYAAASLAARKGLRTVVVEGGEKIGGLCILRGCMPSKALLASAKRAADVRSSRRLGVRSHLQELDMQAVQTRKRALVEEFANYRREQLTAGKFHFIRGNARFVDAHTVAVSPLPAGPDYALRAQFFLISTGSRSFIPSLRGLPEIEPMDSDQFLECETLPHSITILGGGAIALEAASFYSGAGTSVTLLQRSERLLKEAEPEASESIARGLRARGVTVRTGVTLQSCEWTPEGDKRVRFFDSAANAEEYVDSQEVFCAMGRIPFIAPLNLGAAGISTPDARLSVRETQQTEKPHIFAAGDVSAPVPVVHLAIAEGELAIRNILRLASQSAEPLEHMDYRMKMLAVFSDPGFAMVGMTELEAASLGRAVRASSYPFADLGKAMVDGDTDGFVKLVVDEVSREIIGATVVGCHAAELIHEVAVAMHFRATAGDLSRVPHYHPTLSEIWTYPAEELA